MVDKIDWRIVCVGILALAGIEVCALMQGVNGTLLTVVVGVIALSIGVAIPSPLSK